jgi:N-acetylglutamate synthase-like GNAT family acetyltransferase
MPSNSQVRRATVDDLVALRRLWQRCHWPIPPLEHRLTDFQVIETPAGEVLGCVALRIAGRHGFIHSEAFTRPEQADALRGRLWNRILSLARHHRLIRLWVQQTTAPFWAERGFEPAKGELQTLPPPDCGARADQPWLTLQVAEEPSATVSVEQELALFRAAQQAEEGRMRRRTRQWRVLAGVIVLGLLGLILLACWYVLQHFPKLLNRP